VGGFGAVADVEEDESIKKDGAKHGGEDPEVVKPETFDGEGVVDPTLLRHIH
jgi:hypothetical protein